MQINEAMFVQNGKTGYVLRPEHQFHAAYDPTNKNSVFLKQTKQLNLKVLFIIFCSI